MSKIIAICGPDGAGKTTLVEELAKRDYKVLNFGRKGEFVFSITKLAFKMYYFLRGKQCGVLSRVWLYFFVYPLEYINNLFKFLYAKRLSVETTFFDRYDVDRMWRANIKNKTHPLQKILDRMLFFLYLHFYPRADKYFFLLPDAKILFDRRGNFYKEVDKAKRMRAVYLRVSQILEESGVEVYVFYNTVNYKVVSNLL
jgi:hypothetical protein